MADKTSIACAEVKFHLSDVPDQQIDISRIMSAMKDDHVVDLNNKETIERGL